MKEIDKNYNQQKEKKGKVWLLGAGPGDIGLLTCKAKQVLEIAEVVIFDALVSPEILALIPEQAEKINVGKRAGNHIMSQEEINQKLLEKALEGKKVVRLKGGDPFVFGRGGEELELLIRKGKEIPFEIVPGVTSAVAVPAYAGIPVTHRNIASSFHIITGHAMQGKEKWIDYDHFVKTKETFIFLMGVSSLQEICEGLLKAGMEKTVPAAIISKGTTARQKNIMATVGTLVERAKEAEVETPAIIMIGEVCKLAESYSWIEKRLLNGKRILVTRPMDRSPEIAEKLRFLGAQVIEMPSIKIKKLENNQRLKQVIEQICQTRQEQWLVFTSPSGITLFFRQLQEWKVDLRYLYSSQIRIAVIGSGTAKELIKYGIFADIIPEEYSAAALGRKLVEVLTRQEWNKKFPIYIIRAKEGSEDLLKPLQRAGIFYEDIPIYQTIFVKNEILTEKVKEILDRKELDFVIFTSASTVRGFIKAIELDRKEIKVLGEFYAVCIGEKTAEEARKQGMKVLVSTKAELESIVERICLHVKEEKQEGERIKWK